MRNAGLLLAVVLAVSSTAEDRVISPRIDPLAAVEPLPTPVVDRSHAPELGRVVLQPLSGDSGVVHALANPPRLALPAGSLAPLGTLAVEGAELVRIRFTDAPPGTVLWLAGSLDEELIRFEPSPDAEWGPTTRGGTIFIAAEQGRGAVTLAELASIATPRVEASCLTDVACAAPEQVAPLGDASRAIGYMRYVRDGKSHVCTGGLVNDAQGSGTPYFLTARHCAPTQEVASTIEIVWDLRSDGCGSNRMLPVSRSYGAELLVASEATDVALLKLRSIPAGRSFLGVDTRPLAPGTRVSRISHASGLSQTWSAGTIDDRAAVCASAPRPRFIYSRQTEGATSNGSSGAPLLLEGGFIAGQLLGLCGADPASSCAAFNAAVDGSIRASWTLLKPYLDPSASRRRRAVR